MAADREPVRNDDAAWDRWPVEQYLAENYRVLHPVDAAVIRHHSAFYRRFRPGRAGRCLEFGAGPNLYPLMLAAAAARTIDAWEVSRAGVAYLTRQLEQGPDASWLPFYALCRALDPALPPTLPQALARVRVVHRDARTVPAGAYDLASMNFVAESVTEDPDEFAAICRAFAGAVRPGGHLVAAFMENMPSYRIGDSPPWPGHPVDAVRAVFAPYTADLRVVRLGRDPTLPDYGDTGMVLLTAARSPAGG
jgi:hypothetical protein